MKAFLRKLFRSAGYEISSLKKNSPIPADMQVKAFEESYQRCRPYSYTSIEPLFSLFQSTRYIIQSEVPGVLVECGVWKGGSAMMMALAMLQLKRSEKEIWLYDTFEGMTDPGNEDIDFRGDAATNILAKLPKSAEEKNFWCVGTLDEVKKNLSSTHYPSEKLKFIKGKVEETIPENIPDQIALLRLDTDWYQSTAHEMEHLYPKLVSGGILIIDDYGHWKGARKAVDEYFQKHQIKILLHRIDYSVRIAIKP